MAGPTVKNSAYSSKPSNNQPRLAASRMFHWLRLSEWYHGCDATTVSDMRTLVVHKRAAGGTPGPKSLAIRAVSEHPTRGCRTLQGCVPWTRSLSCKVGRGLRREPPAFRF